MDPAMAETARSQRRATDRRRTERAPVTVAIQYATVDALFSEFTRNINEGGVFVTTREPLPLDAPVTVQFRLPGSGDAIQAHGRVVRVEAAAGAAPGGMAIEFEELDRDARQRIDRLVRSLRAQKS
jgi:uncharacterized protein (TIGR02266 family)